MVGVNNGTNSYSGIYIDLLTFAETALNFTRSGEMVIPPGGTWGTRDANGTWNGLVKVMQERRVDLMFAPLSNSIDRCEALDFSHVPVEQLYYIGVYRKPAQRTSSVLLLVRPFSAGVWLLLLVSVPLYTLVVSAVHVAASASQPGSEKATCDSHCAMKGAKQVSASFANITTSFLCSTKRLAFSITISAT